MKNIVEYIDQFLKGKNIEWVGRQIFDVKEEKCITAKDEDFIITELHSVRLKNSKGEIAVKQILVTEELFLTFNALGNKLEKNLSNEWRNHLLRQPEIQELGFRRFIKGWFNTEDSISKDLNENKELQNVLENIDTETEKEDKQLKQEIKEYLADKKNNDLYNHNSFDDILE